MCDVTEGVIWDWEGVGKATVDAVMVVVKSATVGNFYERCHYGVQ